MLHLGWVRQVIYLQFNGRDVYGEASLVDDVRQYPQEWEEHEFTDTFDGVEVTGLVHLRNREAVRLDSTIFITYMTVVDLLFPNIVEECWLALSCLCGRVVISIPKPDAEICRGGLSSAGASHLRLDHDHDQRIHPERGRVPGHLSHGSQESWLFVACACLEPVRI